MGIHFPPPPGELYHLSTDPGEARNLADEHPARLESLVNSFNQLEAEMAAPLWGGPIRPTP
jgi:hypothetical protein